MATKIEATVQGQVFVYESALDLPAMEQGLIRKGLKETLDDAASTAKPADDEETASKATRIAAAKSRHARIIDGTYVFGAGGGGGSRLSFAEKAERAVLEAWARDQGKKAPAAKKFATRDGAWAEVTRVAVLAEVQSSGLDEDEVKALDLTALTEANMQTVKDAYKSAIDEKAKQLEAASKGPKTGAVIGLSLTVPDEDEEQETDEETES